MAYRLARSAEARLDALLLDSARQHGRRAAERYALLILTVLSALGEDPSPPGCRDIPPLPGIRAYPIRLARLRIAPPQRVGAPRHLVVYRVAPDGVTEILGFVHDRMVLSRAAARVVG